MKKALLAVFVFAVLCAFAGLRTLKNFDEKLRSEIVASVSEKTGRTLSIDGKTTTHFSLNPSLTVSGIKLSNASWAQEPYMLRIDDMTVEIELMPLLGRRIRIKRFVLNGVRIDLEKERDGRNNWTFPAGGEAAVENVPSDERKTASRFGVDNVVLQNAEFVLTDKRTEKRFEVNAESLNFESNAAGMTLRSRWKMREGNFTLSTEAFPETGEAYRFQADLSTPGAGAFVKVDGTLTRPDNRIDASVQAEVADLSVLNPFLSAALPAVENTKLKARLAGTPDSLSVSDFEATAGTVGSFRAEAKGNIQSFKPLRLSVQAGIDAPAAQKIEGMPYVPETKLNLSVSIGDGVVLDRFQAKAGNSDLTGRAFVKTEKDISIQADFRSSRLDLSELSGIKTGGFDAPTIGTGRISDRPEKTGVFSDEPLPFDRLRAANVNIAFTVDDFIAADGTDLGKVSLTAGMRDGKFTMPEFKLANYLSGSAVFDVSGEIATVGAGVKIDNLPLKLFYTRNGLERGTLNGGFKISGRGGSERALASSLNGRIFLKAQDVYFSSFRFAGLPENITFLRFLSQRQPLAVSCAVVNVPVENGVLSSRKKIGLESGLFDAQVNGVVNFGTEKVDLTVNVSPRSDGILESILNSFSVNGTLLETNVSVNQEKTFDRVLSLGRAFFMGGKEAAQEMIKQDALKNVCADALAGNK